MEVNYSPKANAYQNVSNWMTVSGSTDFNTLFGVLFTEMV